MAKHRLTWTGDGSLDLSQVLDDRGVPILFPKKNAEAVVTEGALKHPLVQRYLKPGGGLKSEPLGEGPAVPAAPAAAPAAPPKPKPEPAPEPKPKEKAPEPEAKAEKKEDDTKKEPFSDKASDSDDVVTSAKGKKKADKTKPKSRGK